jgi:signal transduction histidine kinase
MTSVVRRRTVRTVTTAADRPGEPTGRAPGEPEDPPFGRPALGGFGAPWALVGGPGWHRGAFGPPPVVRLVGPAVIVGFIQIVGSFGASRGQPDARSLDVGAIALLLVGPLALLARRRHPGAALVAAFAAATVFVYVGYPVGPVFLSVAVAVVNAVLRGRRIVAWIVLAAGWVLFGWFGPLHEDGPWPNWSAVGGLGAWLLVLGAGSELVRNRVDRAAQIAWTRAEESRRRASEERLRIARELHDVLAHDISLINVRAGVALHLVDERPDAIDAEQVRDALAAIKDASRDALGELRSVLDVLRHGEGGRVPLAPTTGLSDLDALVDRARGTGLDVRVERVNGMGTPAAAADVASGLPAGVDLAAFRVAQEALTNVVRHASATRATVRLQRTDDELEVQVDDDGTHAASTAATPRTTPAAAPVDSTASDASEGEGGRGIAGMRERAQALGGSLESGPRPGRGFRVRARFPLRGGT